jgi:apolipoprotein N-acyltransferase
VYRRYGRSFLRAWRLSALTGAAAYLVGYPFLMSLAEGFIETSGLLVWLFWLAYGLVFTLSFSIFGCGYWLFRRLGFSVLAAMPMALVIAESLQFNLFPNYLGTGLIHSVFLAQAADLGGVYFLSAALALVNAGVYVFWHKKARAGAVSVSSMFAVFGVIAFLWLYGFVRHIELSDPSAEAELEAQDQIIKVGVIQSNLVGLELDELSRTTLSEHIKQSKALLQRREVDLLVWPESAYVRGLRQPLPLDAGLLRGDLDVPIIFGGTSVYSENGRRVRGNANFLIGADGMIRHAYTKQILIPFAEYLPFADWSKRYKDAIERAFPRRNEFAAGQSLEPLILDETRFSTPICYEMIYPDYVQNMVAYAKPNILVTLANDSWFAGSQEPMIHLSLARLRAIEHRRWVIRAANSGVSGIISPAGELVASAEFGEQATVIGSVVARSDLSLYSRFGNWLLYLIVAAFVLRAFWRSVKYLIGSTHLRFV